MFLLIGSVIVLGVIMLLLGMLLEPPL